MIGLLMRLVLFGILFVPMVLALSVIFSPILLVLTLAPGFVSMSFLFTVYMLFPLGFLFGFSALVILIFVVPVLPVKIICALCVLWMCYGQAKKWFFKGEQKWTLEELEDGIVWSKVGPEEFPLVEKLRQAKADFQIKVLARDLIKRQIIVLPEQSDEYSVKDFMDDWRAYAGLLFKISACIGFFFFGISLVGFLALFFGFNVFSGLASMGTAYQETLGVAYVIAIVVIGLGTGITAAYYVWVLTDTTTWKNLIISWLVVTGIAIALGVLFMLMMLPVLLPPFMEAMQAAGY